LQNPPDKIVNTVQWPYMISIKPTLIGLGDSVDISIANIDTSSVGKSVSAVVISPAGTSYSILLDNLSSTYISYPDDFIGASSSVQGNFTVALVEVDSGKLLASSSFTAAASPYVALFNNWIFGIGSAITIGLVATLLTLTYQIASQQLATKNQQLQTERERKLAQIGKERDQQLALIERGKAEKLKKLDEKSQWMQESMKFYMRLVSTDDRVISNYAVDASGKVVKSNSFAAPLTLYHMVRYYKANLDFVDNIGVYYFDDLRSENFLSNVKKVIIDCYREALEDDTILRRYIDMPIYTELQNKDDFKELTEKARPKLEDTAAFVKKFYAAHFVHRWVMFVLVNKSQLISYSAPDEVKESLNDALRPHMALLKKYIDQLNQQFYGQQTTRYFKLYDDKDQLIL